MEESGELAQQVAHFEGSGVKRMKYGEPNPQKMAKEVMDVIRVALQVALYYKIEAQLETLFDENLKRLMPNNQ